MIFRDDDISVHTDLAVLKPVHDIFKKYLVMHTVAIIAKDIDMNTELVMYLKRENFDVQLHCWEHYNFSEAPLQQLETDLLRCKNMFARCGFDKPVTLYPPWNKTTHAVDVMAWDKQRLKVSNKKCSLSYYVANNGKVDVDVVNFHYWDDECKDLDEALRIYNLNR